MSTPRSAVCALIACGCLLFGVTAAEGRTYRQTTEDRLPIDADGVLKLVNRNGQLDVEAWEADEIWLQVTMKVRASSQAKADRAFEETEIRIRELSWGVEIETLPARSSSGWLSWLFGGSEVDVAYRLKVPAQIGLELRTVNGRITVEEVAGETVARTTNGPISLDGVRGPAEVATTNGSVRAEFTDLPADADLSLRTTNGAITVALPSGWGGRVEATTTNGAVRTDVPITVRSTSRRRLQGEIAGGNGRLSLRTVNGSIRLEAAP